MDYSQLSDFEINKRVAICIHPDIKNWNCYDVSGRACFVINEDTPKRVQYGFSFTSDPADAWPIIESSNISINHDAVVEEWIASHGGVIYQHCRGKRPLRLAMECFLKMQDTNHA